MTLSYQLLRFKGIAYEKDNGPTTVNQLTDNPVDDLIPLDSRELS